jgi:putative oxidoreductase
MPHSRFAGYAPYALAALRIVAALIFIEHGTAKLFSWPEGVRPAGVELMSLLGLAGILEVVGGLLLLVGLWTRPVAFILSGQMAAAYWMAHARRAIWPAANDGDAAILYCFVFLYLAFAGAGAWAADNRR